MAGDIQLPTGTTATIAIGSGSASAVSLLKSIGSNDSLMSMSDVSGLSDTSIKRKPNREDPGTVSFTMFSDDTSTASHQYTVLKTAKNAKNKVIFVVNLPGSGDDSTPLLSFTGYLSSVTSPEVAPGDEALTYTATLQISGY